jgi:hypothetical protein
MATATQVSVPVKVVKKTPVPSKVATLATQAKVKKARDLKKQIAALEAELKPIEEFVDAELDRKGVNLLTTKDGIPVVGRTPQSRFYPKDVEDFVKKWPKLAAKYLTETKFYRKNWYKTVD